MKGNTPSKTRVPTRTIIPEVKRHLLFLLYIFKMSSGLLTLFPKSKLGNGGAGYFCLEEEIDGMSLDRREPEKDLSCVRLISM